MARRPPTRLGYLSSLLLELNKLLVVGAYGSAVYEKYVELLMREVVATIINRPELLEWYRDIFVQAWRSYFPDIAPPDITENLLRAKSVMEKYLVESQREKLMEKYITATTRADLESFVSQAVSTILVTAATAFFRQLGLLR